MYLKGTKCQLLIASCFLSISLLAKETRIDHAAALNKPLCFVENKGQIVDEHQQPRTDIQYKLSTSGLNLYVGEGKLSYQFRKVTHGANSPEITGRTMEVTLLGANKNATAVSSEKIDYYENYYLSRLGKEGITASSYKKVTYRNIYPAIDWVVYVNESNVEYDFVVHPGGNPDDIKIKYNGATKLSLTATGGILAHTPMGDVTEKCPVAFETETGKPVASKFQLNKNVISFRTGSYNGSLTIDPYLSWCTYFGGSNDEYITSVKCSPADGSIFVTGYTASTNLPLSTGAFRSTNTGGTGSYDAFVARYNAAGTSLMFATYFGGDSMDVGNCIAIDNSGTNIYVVGNTKSPGISYNGFGPVYHSTIGGGTEMFLAKFSNSGARTLCTYMGGSGEDYANAVAVDLGGYVYVGGSTTTATASSIIAGGTPFQSTNGGATDGYLAKFNGGTGAIQWATYLGGSSDDEILGVACSGAGKLLYTGRTKSVTQISTTGAPQTTFGGGSYDAMLGSFNTGGSGTRAWGTYLGGSGSDAALGVAVDGNSDVYITGNTTSTDSITSGIAYYGTFAGGIDAFLVKYSSGGNLLWGTYIGGNSLDYGQGVNVDIFGNVVVTGTTLSSSGLATTYAYQTVNGGGSGSGYDAFVSKFNTYGQNLYTTYFGKGGTDNAYAVCTDFSNSNVIIAGVTNSISGLAYNAFQDTIGGNSGSYHDGFVTKFAPDTLVAFRQQFTDTLICVGGTLLVHDSTFTGFNFQSGNYFKVELSDASGSFASVHDSIGSSATTATGTITCTIPTTVTPGYGYRIRLVASNPFYVSPDDIYDIHIVNALPPSYASGTTPVCVGQTLRLYDSVPYPVSSYSWTGPGFTSVLQNPTRASVVTGFAGTYSVTTTHNGCPSVTDTVGIVVSSFFPPVPTDSAAFSACTNSPVQLFANSGMAGSFGWLWTGPAGFSATSQNPIVAHLPGPGRIVYYVRDTLNACPSNLDSVVIIAQPNDTPNITISVSPNDTVCEFSLVHFTSLSTFAGYSPTFQWISNPSTAISGAVYDYYNTSTFPTGVDIQCVLTSSVACPDKPHDTSNVIHMTLLNTSPVVHIFALSDTFISRGGAVAFNSTVMGTSLLGGIWYINNVAHADSAGWLSLRNIQNNDTIRYEVASNATCANIGVSNTIIIRVNVGVSSPYASFENIHLSPNPNEGNFNIVGEMPALENGTVSIDILNALGQVVQTLSGDIQSNALNVPVSLKGYAPGLYMAHLKKDGLEKTIRFILD